MCKYFVAWQAYNLYLRKGLCTGRISFSKDASHLYTIHTFAKLFENWVLVNKIVSEIHRCLFSDENLHCITQQSQPIYPCEIFFFLIPNF